MDLIPTLTAAAAALVLTALFGWAGARPPDPRRGPRLVPWRFLMVLSAAGALLMLVHLVTLFGGRTGG